MLKYPAYEYPMATCVFICGPSMVLRLKTSMRGGPRVALKDLLVGNHVLDARISWVELALTQSSRTISWYMSFRRSTRESNNTLSKVSSV